MDIGAMKEDLTRCLNLLPKGMINPVAVAEWIGKWRPKLEELIPGIIETLSRHVRVGMFDAAMGQLDTEEVERACIEVLLSFGMNIPNENPGQTG